MKLNKTALLTALTFSSALLASQAYAAPKAAQVNYRVLKDAVALQINADGSYTETVTRVLQPLTVAGVSSIGHLEIQYPANFAAVKLLQDYTETASHKKVPVPASQIFNQTTQAAVQAPFLSDGHVISVLYPAVTPGALVHLQYTITYKHPYLPGVYAASTVLSPKVPAQNVSLSITAPKGMKLYYNARGQWHQTYTFKDGMQTMSATTSWDKVIVPPASSADITQYAPMAVLSTVNQWEDMAKAYNKLAAGTMKVTPAISALAHKIADGATGEQAVERVYSWMQQNVDPFPVEYSNASFLPPSAQSTLERGMGDSNANVTLFCALLQALDIKAVPAMISQTNRFVAYPGVDPFAFDYFLAYIPAYHQFIDTNALYAGANALPAEDQGRPVLITGDQPTFSSTPGPQPDVVQTQAVRDVTLAANGDMDGTSTLTAAGFAAMSMRADALSDRTGRRLQTYVQNGFFLGGSAGSIHVVSVKDRDDLNKPVQLVLNWHVDQAVIPGKQMAFLPPDQDAIAGDLVDFTSQSTRSVPSVVQPGTIDEVMHLHLPAGMTPEQLPANQSLNTPFGSYTVSYKFADGVLDIEKRLQLTKFVITPQEYPELHKMALLAVSGTRNAVVLHKAG